MLTARHPKINVSATHWLQHPTRPKRKFKKKLFGAAFYQADEVVITPTERSALPEPQIRDKIFNSELENLTSNVISHTPQSELLLEKESEQAPETTVELKQEFNLPKEKLRNIELDDILPTETLGEATPEIIYELNNFYNPASTAEPNPQLSSVIKHINDGMRFDAYAMLKFDPIYSVYRVYQQNGLDEITTNNLFVKPGEIFIREYNQILNLESQNIIKNYFYRKRFSYKNLLKYQSINSILVEDNGFGILFIFFYYDHKRALSVKFTKKLLKILHEYDSLLLKQNVEIRKQTSRDLIAQNYRTLRNSLDADNVMNILTVSFQELSSFDEFRQQSVEIKESIQHLINHRKEKIFIRADGVLYIILNQTKPEDVASVVKEVCAEKNFRFDLKVTNYPEKGYNLYCY